MKKPYVIGITGGIACGKTAVSDILAELGAYIIDADVVSREVISSGNEGEKLVKEAFPNAFVDGVLDRKVLREKVFSDKSALDKLNSITHPLIKSELSKKILSSNAETVFLVVPLMFETGCDELCDYVLAVSADEETRITRLKNRNTSINDETARSIVRSQMCESERVAKADEVIENNGGLEELKAKVVEFYKRTIGKNG